MDLGIDDVTRGPHGVCLNNLQGTSAADLIMGAFAGKLHQVEGLVLSFGNPGGFEASMTPLEATMGLVRSSMSTTTL
jgi:hypothetical protein